MQDKQLLDKFCETVWTSGLTDKGKSAIKFFENLIVRFNNDQEGITTEDEEDEIITEENEFAYEDDLRSYLLKNLSVIEKGLKLYEMDGKTGEEFYVAGTLRRIEILAVDNQNKSVVIELNA